MDEPKSFVDWLNDVTEDGCRRPLTEEERTQIEVAYRAHCDAALRTARAITRVDEQEAWNIVHGGLARMIKDITEGDKPLPTDPIKIGRRLLNYVRNASRQVAAGCEWVRPKRKFWGQKLLAAMPKRRVSERALTMDMSELSELCDASVLPESAGDYHEPPLQQEDLDDPRLEMAQSGRHALESTTIDEADAHWDLAWILECACEELPPGQRAVIELFLDGKSRQAVCEEQHIEPPTYDTHFARAKENMRFTLLSGRPWLVLNAPWQPEGCHFTQWSEEFTRMEAARLARLQAPPDRSAA